MNWAHANLAVGHPSCRGRPYRSRAADGVHRCRDSQAGFTLLELLVALGVFAIMATLAYAGLDAVLDARRATDDYMRTLARTQTAFHIMGNDIGQVVGREVRDAFGDAQPALHGSAQGDDGFLELTRGGVRNPARLPRSSLQRVAYRLEDGELRRLSWYVLDRAQDSEPLERALLESVDEVGVRFLDSALKWHDTWPPALELDKPRGLPAAIELEVEMEGWGRVRRLYPIPSGAGVLPAGG